MTTVAIVLGLWVLLAAVTIPVAVVVVRLALAQTPAVPPRTLPLLRDRSAEAEALGFVPDGPGRWVRPLPGSAPMVLQGHDEGGILRHVQRLSVDGGWVGLTVRPGRMPSLPTGDGAFDRHHVVEGEALHLLDDASRHALSAEIDAPVVLEGGVLVATPGPGASLGRVVMAMQAAQTALDAAPASDAELAATPGQLGAVRAEALRRCRDLDTARRLVDDPDPDVRLLAAMLVDPTRLGALVLDPEVPVSVRHKAASALRTLDDDMLDALVDSDSPELWSLVAKADVAADRRVERLRRLVRPGALDASDWPEDHRVPHIGAKLAMALGEAPPEDAEALLLQLLAMPEPRVRLQVCRSLAQVGGLGSVPALWERVDEDEDPRVRKEARAAAEALEGTARGGVSLAPAAVGQGAVSVLEEAAGALSMPELEEREGAGEA